MYVKHKHPIPSIGCWAEQSRRSPRWRPAIYYTPARRAVFVRVSAPFAVRTSLVPGSRLLSGAGWLAGWLAGSLLGLAYATAIGL